MNISHLNLEDHQLRLCMDVINMFGSGQHPTANHQTIDGFHTDYLGECIVDAINSDNLTEKGTNILNEVKDKIEETQEYIAND